MYADLIIKEINKILFCTVRFILQILDSFA